MIIWRDTCPSTNSDPAVLDPEAPHGLVVAAREQTAGRGQRGNTWESGPGLNLSFSIVLRPAGIHPARQFCISEAVALAVAETVEEELCRNGVDDPVYVKWPNDIYVGDRKICGILIENTITGTHIDKSIVGIGLNVNQREFLSDAPNPVSLIQLTARETPLDSLLDRLTARLLTLAGGIPTWKGGIPSWKGGILPPLPHHGKAASCRRSPNPPTPPQITLSTHDSYSPQITNPLHQTYLSRLWRNDGALHRWRDPSTGEIIDASIVDVAPDGILTLRHADTTLHPYAFKQITPLL